MISFTLLHYSLLLLGGSTAVRQQSVSFQPVSFQAHQLLQERAAELVKIERENQRQKSAQDTNAAKPDEDDTTSRGSAGGRRRSRSQGARKRKAIAEANAETAKAGKGNGELREALDLFEAHLGTRTRHCDSEGGTHASCVNKVTVTRVLRSISKKEACSKEPEIVDLDGEESVSERVAIGSSFIRLSSPDGRKKPVRQPPRLSSKSDKSTGSDMRSGSLSRHKLKS